MSEAVLARLPINHDTVDSTWVGLLRVGPACVVCEANAAARAMAGDAPVENQQFCHLFPSATTGICEPGTCRFAHVFAGTERRTRPRWTTLLLDGTPTSVLMSAKPIPSAHGGVEQDGLITLVLGTYVDDADRRRRDMIATGLHEMRHAMAVQSAALDLLTELDLSDLSPDAQRVMDTLQSATSYLTTCLDDLRNRALFDLGVVLVHPYRVDVVPIVQGVCERLRPMLRRRDQRVVLNSPFALIAWVDAAALEHILVNLLLNAHKYAQAQDAFVVTVKEIAASGQLELTVRDHGPGVVPRDRQRIFQRFYRAAQHSHMPGAGLGLAVVQNLVAQHGGSVGVRSGRGGGSVFWVRLPTRPIQPEHAFPARVSELAHDQALS